MGLKMDGIHTPSVLGQTKAIDHVERDKLSLLELIAGKEFIEKEMLALNGVLESVRPRACIFWGVKLMRLFLAWRQHEHRFDYF